MNGDKTAVTIRNAHTLADMVHRANGEGPIDALHLTIDMLVERREALQAVANEYDELIRHMCAGGDFHEFMVKRGPNE